MGRWERGVDIQRFDPAKADRDAFPGEVKVLYAGRLTREKGVHLLAESFLRAHASDPRLHLLIAGGGPEEGELRERLGERATFLGWLEDEELPRAYASADAFLFASSTDTYGQVILEAAASGLAIVAVGEGGPAALIENRHTGLLCRPDADHLAGTLMQLASSPQLRRQLGEAAARAARERSWERSMGQLAAGYRRALDAAAGAPPHAPAPAAQDNGTAPADQPGAPQYDGAIDDPALYFNRELSWLDFNQRVLELAEDPEVPLLERLRFCGIYASNLDEFFMVRVAGLFDQLDAGIDARGPDGLAPSEQIDAIQQRVLELDDRLCHCFGAELRPALAELGIKIVSLETASETERREIDARFEQQVFPALTPLVIGLGRPFPYISNLSLSLGVLLRDPESGNEIIARIKVPKELLGRFLPVGEGETSFVPLEEVIAANLDALFPGTEVIDYGYFRVTRDADFTVSDEADDLLQAVQDEIRRRRFGEVVRLEIASGMNPKLREQLIAALRLEDREVYDIDGLLDLADVDAIADVPGHAELRYAPWTPVTQPRLQGEEDERVDMFAEIRQRDLLVHHPYDSFGTSVERFVTQAVADPDVLAIKQTVYRTSDDSALVPSLIRASERGKQAVCMVELKARFDEEANIHWAKSLEEAGVHVVYGIPGLKTHVKAILVARREGERVREYVHIGTGNYNPKTARLYTDFGLFTADPDIGADVAEMFNFLTGYGRPAEYRKVLVSPTTMRDQIVKEIERTIAAHKAGEEARIALKMNALVDARCIQALYEASQAGVRIDLNVRGICCLRPGVEGVSENIHVCSIVGRFLEHSRIYAFRRGEETRVLMGSADLMPRNLDSRVELVTPVEDAALKAELLDVLERCFADNASCWELGADGNWTRRQPDGEVRSAQEELMARHSARAAEHLAATAA
ncbi:MAG: polyphosphate kinase 1 [Solirubrobacterales bacterium]